MCLPRTSLRYEIEWIGREGLAPETHDAYLKVKKNRPTNIYLRVKIVLIKKHDLNERLFPPQEFINHFYKNTLKLIGV